MLALLGWLSRGYGWAVAARRARWRRAGQRRLPAPAISVGNITVGGTGKTEAVAFVCRRLLDRGLRPAVLSRGYRRRGRESWLLVSDGSGPKIPVAAAGDEPYLLAKRLPGAAVVVGADRLRTAEVAVRTCGCNVLVLDDGFQRRDSIHRDLDIVLVDASDPFGGDALLPAGRLREPAAALAEADLLVITRADQHDPASLRERLGKLAPGVPVLAASHEPRLLVSLSGRESVPPAALRQRKIFAVSGIARPDAFLRSLQSLGARIEGQMAFPDHHWYTARDLRCIAVRAKQAEAEVVTTSKDAVRLPWPAAGAPPAWALEVAFTLLPPDGIFTEQLERALAASGRDEGPEKKNH